MKPLRQILAGTGRGPRAAFGLGAAALAAVLAWPVDGGPAPPPRAPAPVPAPGDMAALHRPLFDPGRRAWSAAGSRAALLAGDPPRPILTVRGILIDGASARALIDDGAQTWLARGEGRGDWRITAIARDRVTVAQGERLYTADLLGPPATLRPVGARPVPDGDAPPALRR